MKLQIIGNVVELHRTVESFKDNFRAEQSIKQKRRVISASILIGADIAAIVLLAGSIFTISDWSWRLLSISVCSVCFVALAIATAFAIIKIPSDDRVEQETIAAAHDMFHVRQTLLNRFHSGQLLTASVVSVSSTTLCIDFDCEEFGKEVKTYRLKPFIVKTMDESYCGKLVLNLQTNQATYYYLDDITAEKRLELVNQFLPKG